MSCKLLPPDDARSTPSISWRQVGGASPAAEPQSNGSPPDWTASLDELRAEFEQRVRDARTEGRREGEASAVRRTEFEVKTVIERLGRSIDEMADLRPRLRAQAEADIVKLALAIARRVLRRELSTDPEALTGIVGAVLIKLQGMEICRVRTHPAHVGQIAECLRNRLPASTIEVVAEPGGELGAAIFETRRGNLDASLDTQLLEIERGLADRLRSAR